MGYCITLKLIMKIPFLSHFFKHSGGHGPRMSVSFRGKSVLFVGVKRSGSKIQVVSFATRQLTESTSQELAKICGALNLSGSNFSTLLGHGEYQLQVVEAPNVPTEELKSAVRWLIKDQLSYHVDEAMIDILQIPSARQVTERPKSLYVVAASKDVINKRMNLFVRAKLELNVIDIPEMAQRNIAALFEDEGRALAVLAFDETGGMLTFTSAGELYLARRIEITLGQLQDADESLRKQYIERLELEVQRSMDYFDRQFNHVTVSRLLVALPARIGLVDALRENLYVPVELLDLSQVLDMSKMPELEGAEAQFDAFYALGAALRQESQKA